MFGAALYRLRKEDFGELRHYDGISPAWPIGYDEWNPITPRPSSFIRCMASTASTRPSRRRAPPYPCAARLARAAHRQARPTTSQRPAIIRFTLPAAVLMNEADMPYSACIRCQTCDGFPCLLHAKSDAEVIAVRPALEQPNVTLLRNARALKLETNASGTAVTGVVAEVDGKPQRFAADIVVVSCGAANSAALLLRSANDRASRTASPTARARLDATTCSTTARRCWRCR